MASSTAPQLGQQGIPTPPPLPPVSPYASMRASTSFSPTTQILTVGPRTSGHHTHTFIVLHGRGDTALGFGPSLLIHPIPASALFPRAEESSPSSPPSSTAVTATSAAQPEETNLWDCFSTVRFVFPTAAPLPARVLHDHPINQWFDCASVSNTSLSPEWTLDGLKRTCEMLADLVQTELKILEQPEGQSGEGESYGEGSGSAKQGGKIVLMGLSQGCASVLTAILALRGEPSMEKVAAVVGMCGWLPLEHELQNVMRNEENDELDSAAYDIDARRFAATVAAEQCDQAQVPKYHLLAPVTGYLKRALGLALSEYSTFATAPPPPPIFIGHGAKDTKVPTARGREAAECLSTIVGVGNAESSGPLLQTTQLLAKM